MGRNPDSVQSRASANEKRRGAGGIPFHLFLHLSATEQVTSQLLSQCHTYFFLLGWERRCRL